MPASASRLRRIGLLLVLGCCANVLASTPAKPLGESAVCLNDAGALPTASAPLLSIGSYRGPRVSSNERAQRLFDQGLVFVNLVETDQVWGHRNDPVNFHRCLQDFDRRLPDILEALRDGDLLVITSDHGCDPTTPSTDHSREYALLLAEIESMSDDEARAMLERETDGHQP